MSDTLQDYADKHNGRLPTKPIPEEGLNINKLRVIRDYLIYETVDTQTMTKMIHSLLPNINEDFILSRVSMFLIGIEYTDLSEVSELVESIQADIDSYRREDV